MTRKQFCTRSPLPAATTTNSISGNRSTDNLSVTSLQLPDKSVLTAFGRRVRAGEKFNGKSPEEILRTSLSSYTFTNIDKIYSYVELQRKGWRSPVYDHFQPPVIVEVKGEILYR